MNDQQLQNVTNTQLKERSNNKPPANMSSNAKVVSVHDGNTCDLVIIRNGLERFECRLFGIDTPELRTGLKAEKARDFLAWLCIG